MQFVSAISSFLLVAVAGLVLDLVLQRAILAWHRTKYNFLSQLTAKEPEDKE